MRRSGKIAFVSVLLLLGMLCSCGIGGGTKDPEPGMTEGEQSIVSDENNKAPSSYELNGSEKNVKTFGAVGDGKTDDTEAVAAALESAKENGGTLYFPKGTYRLTDSVAVNSDVTLAFADGAMINTEKTFRVTTEIKAGNTRIFGEGNFKCIIRNEYVNPMWFGAVGDGVTDDTEAFLNAFESNCNVRVPYTEKGFAVGGIDLKKSVTLKGIDSEDGQRAKLVGIKNKDMFIFSTNEINISNLDIDMSDSGNATVFFYDTSAAGKTYYHLYDINITGAYRVIRDAEVITNYVTNSLVENVNCYAGRGTAFDMKCFWGFVFFRDLVIDYSESEAKYGVQPNFPAVKLENNAGCIFQRMKIVGDGNADNLNAHGFQYVNDVATWMDGCEFVNVTGNCVNVSGSSSHLYFSNMKSTGCVSDAFSFASVTFLQVHGLEIDGGRNGINLTSCNGAQITDCNIKNVTQSGIMNNRSRGTSVVGCTASDCGEWGYFESSALGSAVVDGKFDNCAKGQCKLDGNSGSVNG